MTQQGGSFLDGLLQGIKIVQGNGAPVANEPAINFIGALVVDDPTNHRTNVTISADTHAVSGTGFWHSTRQTTRNLGTRRPDRWMRLRSWWTSAPIRLGR